MPDDKGKKLGPAYWLAGAAVLGTNIYDVENTLRCIDSGTCREGNAPMIPFMKNRLAAYGVSLPLYAVAMYGAAEFKRSDSKKVRRLWPLPLIVVGAGHILLGLDANRY